MANIATPAQIDRQIADALGLSRGRTAKGRLEGFGTTVERAQIGADVLVGLDIRWTGSQDFSKLPLESAEYMKYSSERMAREIRARTISGRLPSRFRTHTLSKRYAKWKGEQGARPIRDGVVSGQMWRGWGAYRVKNKNEVTLGFRGQHRPSGNQSSEPFKARAGKYKGQWRSRTLTNQRIANRWALRGRRGKPHKESFRGRPFHAFVEADRIQKVWFTVEYERRVLHKGLDELPPIKGMGERIVGRGQRRRVFERIEPRSR